MMNHMVKGAIIGGAAELMLGRLFKLIFGGIVLCAPLLFGLYCLGAFHEWATGAQEAQAPVFRRIENNTRTIKEAFAIQKSMISVGETQDVWYGRRFGYMDAVRILVRNDSELTIRGARGFCEYDAVEVWKKNYSTYHEAFTTSKINTEVGPGQHVYVDFPTPGDRRPEAGQKLAGPIRCHVEPVIDFDEFESNYRFQG